MNEFELISRYFDRPVVKPQQADLGIGDDCALLTPTTGRQLAISTDMLVAGRHFFDDVEAASLGWKALAVNLSDLAAMGAIPRAFTLALALPSIDEEWLDRFSAGLFDCASRHRCPLIGGDTTRGPLNVCITVFGEVAAGKALRRDAARLGDDIWISGEPGRAALALRTRADASAALREALDRPTPRVALGAALVEIAHAAIDVSDGLAQDLGHVLTASLCGATIDAASLPFATGLATLEPHDREMLVLAGGDDYELCFTAPSDRRGDVERVAAGAAVRVTRIGTITDGTGLRLENTTLDPRSLSGYDHFA